MPASSKGSAMFQRLKVGPMKRLYKYYTPDAINIAGGVPMDKIFPFREISVELSGGGSFKIQNTSTLSLNYNRGDGIPHLRDWIRNHVQALHSIKKEFQSCVTVGSTDAYTKILMLFNGDTVIFDKFAYGAAVSTCSAFGRHSVGVSTDKDGMIPDSLREQVERARRRGLKPDLVYLVPTAQNPTGVTMSDKRKREIYKTCCDLDLTIIEDDAYYYLHFENESDRIQSGDIYDISRMPGIDNLPKSLYSMDTENRVLRIDSLSKSVAPGMRLGWIAGPPDVVEKYQLLQEQTSQFPSGFSQSIFSGLVNHWSGANYSGNGFDLHVREIQAHYKRQRDSMLDSLEDNFRGKKGVVFNKPSGGMFIWLQLESDLTSEDLFKHLAAAGVITVPGGDFLVPSLNSTGEFVREKDPSIVRLTYAAAQPKQIQDAVKRLVNGVKSLGI